MNYMPPIHVQQIGSRYFPRFVLRDQGGKYWARDRWSHMPGDAVLFANEIDAIATKNRYCLEKVSETFTATAMICARAADGWTAEELAAWLKEHGRFFVPGPPGKTGISIALLPSAIKKVNDADETPDCSA